MIRNKKIFGLIIVSCLSLTCLTGCKALSFSSDKKVPNINTSVNKDDKNKTKKIEEVNNNNEQAKNEINKTFDEYLIALNDKDIYNIMNYLDPNRKDYKIKQQLFKNIFNEFDIKYISDKRVIDIIDDKTAVLNTTITITNDPRGASKKSVIDDIVFRKVKGEWKIHSEKFLK